MKLRNVLFAVAVVLTMSACTPEVGSDAWCDAMKEKPKGEWSGNDAKEFAKGCVFK